MGAAYDDTTGIMAGSPTIGRRAFIAGGVGALAGATVLSAGHVGAAGVEPGASCFVPMAPVRLCDTRDGWVGVGSRRLNPSTIRVRASGVYGIPTEAVAVALTLTGVNLNWGGNWLAAYPAGSWFLGTSNSNSEYYDQRVANLVTVKLGRAGGDAFGAVDIVSLAPSEVVVDIAGYYLPTAAPVRAGRFELVEPVRVLDTRWAGRKAATGEVVQVNFRGFVPDSAQAVVVNLTAVETDGGGFVTAYPIGAERQQTSNLNYAGNEIRAGAAIVKVGRDPTGAVVGFNLYTMTRTHLLVDLIGYFTGTDAPLSADGLFVPIDPQRLFDSRWSSRRYWPGNTATIPIPSAFRGKARAVAMNLTATSTIGHGYFTAYAAQTQRRTVSSLNAVPGQTVANAIFSKITSSGVSVFTQSGAHIIGDIAGWFTGTPSPITTGPPYNPPPPGGPLAWIVSIPRLGLNQWVFDGDANRIVDSGNTWHWTGTGLVGEGAHVVLFGHRTEHGGPYRYQHNLRGGDMLHVLTSDRRRYNYRMVAEYLSSSAPSDILGKTRLVGGETISIVSCSKLNRLPTDTRFRLITTFALVGWDDLG